MSFFSSMFGWMTGNSVAQRSGIQTAVPIAPAYEDTRQVGPDGALQVSTVWACVKLLAETISSLPLQVYRVNSDNQRVLAKELPIYDILHNSPNRRHTTQEFWETVLLNFLLRGNGYARIDRNGAGDLIGLWPLSSDQMRVEAVRDNSLLYIYRVDGAEIIYPEESILHIRDLGNGIVGNSRLDYMRASVNLATNTGSHTNKTYKKEARRPGLLMAPNVLTKDQRAALKASFSEIVTGGEKELFILEAGFKFEPLGMTPADLQLMETRRFSVEDICRWFGVPSILVNDASQATTWGSGISQIIEGFYKFTVRPQIERIEQALNRRVLNDTQRANGIMCEFNLDALLRASLKDRMDIYAKATQNGIWTRNECRRKENQLDMDGGDMLTAQTNLAPVEMLGELNLNRSSGNATEDPIAQ